MAYPTKHWRALGRYVEQRRTLVEPNTVEWAAKVGRSTRVVLGLERGEPQGERTVLLVANALGVSPDTLFAVLESGVVPADVPSVQAPDPLVEILAELRLLRTTVDQIRLQVADGVALQAGRDPHNAGPGRTEPALDG